MIKILLRDQVTIKVVLTERVCLISLIDRLKNELGGTSLIGLLVHQMQ